MVVSHHIGLSSQWSVTTVVSYPDDLVTVVSHNSGLIIMVSHHSGVSSQWSLVMMVS